MVPVEQGKNTLLEQQKEAGEQMIREQEDVNRKRVIGTLVQRQSELLAILDCVQAGLEEVYEGSGRKKRGGKLKKLLLHPGVTILLSLAALVSALLAMESKEWYWMLIIIMLLIGQSIWRLVDQAVESGKEQKPSPKALLDLERAELVLNRVSSRYPDDGEAICNLFASETLDQMNLFETEVVKIYSSLYEAALDNPDVEDFRYALSLTYLLLNKLGLETVSYSPENRRLFGVEQADYHDEMRCPAIVRTKNGEVVKKGSYVQNVHGVRS